MKTLFRAKTTHGEWVESMTIAKGTIKRKAHLMYMEVAPDNWKQIIPETVCQYTGVDDKNGKKIFHNDLVKDERGRVLQIVWHNHRPKLKNIKPLEFDQWEYADFIDWCDYDTEGMITNVMRVELIGNIHD